MGYSTQCPRCGRKIGPHTLYCKKCLRAMDSGSWGLEQSTGRPLYTLLLILANLGILLYLFWRSYM